MESIITTNLKEITLSSQFLNATTPKGDIEIDIKRLLKEPINSDSAYFNATTIAKMYDVRPNDLFRDAKWKNYVNEMEKQVAFKYNKNVVIKMIKTVRGKHHSGTWLHSKLIVELLRKLDVKFAVAMDLFIQDLIIHSDRLKLERDNTKVLFHPLTDVIRDLYIPNQTSENSKKFAYTSLLTLANLKVLGSSGKKYAKDNDIEIEQGKNIRDYLPQDKLDEISRVEQDIHGMIKYGKMYEYQDIKKELGLEE
jgi:hypothetical protein